MEKEVVSFALLQGNYVGYYLYVSYIIMHDIPSLVGYEAEVKCEVKAAQKSILNFLTILWGKQVRMSPCYLYPWPYANP